MKPYPKSTLFYMVFAAMAMMMPAGCAQAHSLRATLAPQSQATDPLNADSIRAAIDEAASVLCDDYAIVEGDGGDSRKLATYDPACDSIYFYPDNMRTPTEAKATVFHEAVGHKGMRLLFGRHYQSFLANLILRGDSSIMRMIRRWSALPEYSANPLRIADECVARIAEELSLECGDSPSQSSSASLRSGTDLVERLSCSMDQGQSIDVECVKDLLSLSLEKLKSESAGTYVHHRGAQDGSREDYAPIAKANASSFIFLGSKADAKRLPLDADDDDPLLSLMSWSCENKQDIEVVFESPYPASVMGLYDPKEDKISVLINNCGTAKMAVETLQHEAVGHKGLRKLLGDRLPDFLENILVAADKGLRKRVSTVMEREECSPNGLSAMEECLCEIAEEIRFEKISEEKKDEMMVHGMEVLKTFSSDEAAAKARFTLQDAQCLLMLSYLNLAARLGGGDAPAPLN